MAGDLDYLGTFPPLSANNYHPTKILSGLHPSSAYVISQCKKAQWQTKDCLDRCSQQGYEVVQSDGSYEDANQMDRNARHKINQKEPEPISKSASWGGKRVGAGWCFLWLRSPGLRQASTKDIYGPFMGLA